MVFEWLHMPSEHGYNRMRHLSRTPPEFWSRQDKFYGNWDRSKYVRARNKEYTRQGGTRTTQAAQRRFHAKFPGGAGYYFPYAEPLETPDKAHFRRTVDDERHGYKFWQDFENGRYGDPSLLEWLWVGFAQDNHIDPHSEANGNTFMSFVEMQTGRGIEGPLGWGFRGDRPNDIAAAWDPVIGDVVQDPWRFNRNGRRNGPFHAPGSDLWQRDWQPDDFRRQRRRW